MDDCGVCDGDGSSCANETFAVSFDLASDLYGFQFSVENATVVSVSGGAAEDAGFSVSTGNNNVVGFSMTGAFIPAGSGTLVNLEVENGELDSYFLSVDIMLYL